MVSALDRNEPSFQLIRWHRLGLHDLRHGHFVKTVLSEIPKLDTGLVRRLEDAKLIFRWGIHHQVSLCPWVIRAWVLSKGIGHKTDQLRSILCCQPLGKELLSNCFAMEARERSLCYTSMQDDVFAQEVTKKEFREYQARDSDSVFQYYPRQSPAAVTHIWQFASFGEVLTSTRASVDRIRKNERHVLRRLRNALAHGHYPSWRMLTKVRELMRVLV